MLADSTPAEIAWAHAVRDLYAERMTLHVPVPEIFENGPPLQEDWDMARATLEALEPDLIRDQWRTFEILGDGAHAADVLALTSPSTDANGTFEGPVGELRTELDRVVTGAATARAAGDTRRADSFTEEARRVHIAVDELQRDAAASPDGQPRPALIAAERQLLRMQRAGALASDPNDLPKARLFMPRHEREAADAGLARISEQRTAWASAVRTVHTERVEAEARRIAGLGVRDVSEAGVDARRAVHLRDPQLAQQLPASTEILVREGALPVTTDVPSAALRQQYRDLAFRHDEVAEEAMSSPFEGQRAQHDLRAEVSAIDSAMVDLALDHGHTPDAFRWADEAEQAARNRPARRRGLDLRPQLPQRPARPIASNITQQQSPTAGPDQHGPGLR